MSVAAEVLFSNTASRDEQNARGCIRTYTNQLVNPWDIRLDQIAIEDISYHLSNETRYAGAVGFYSVGQHSIEVEREARKAGCTSPYFLLACLLHDSEEAYFKDMPSPIKADPRLAAYKSAAKECRVKILQKFGLDWYRYEDEITKLDHEVYYRERRSFDDQLLPGDHFISRWPAGASHGPFMRRFRELTEEIGAQKHE